MRKVPRRILIVEDNLDAGRTLAFILRQEGYDVEHAINGYSAVDMAKRFRPEIVFLDLGLPGLDGFEVCRRLKREAELAHARIIAVTGYGTEADQVRSRVAGCDAHFVKPVTPQQLITYIQSM